MASSELCRRTRARMEETVVRLLDGLNKPKTSLEPKERLLLGSLEVGMLLCDEIGPDADYDDVNLLLLYEKVDQVLSALRGILVDRAKRRQARARES